jgi:hypothetical protein
VIKYWRQSRASTATQSKSDTTKFMLCREQAALKEKGGKRSGTPPIASVSLFAPSDHKKNLGTGKKAPPARLRRLEKNQRDQRVGVVTTLLPKFGSPDLKVTV